MKTYIIKTYTIEDHPNKSAVIDYVRDNWHQLYSWGEENADSLRAFCSRFNLSNMDYSVSPWGYSYAGAEVSSDLEELSGIRLWKYLQNSGLLSNNLLSGECPLTGYCADEDLLAPIREFIKHPDLSATYQDLIDECLHCWIGYYVADWEYTYSDEGLAEFLSCGEYEFTESGKFFGDTTR